jgi:hypothetical protein
MRAVLTLLAAITIGFAAYLTLATVAPIGVAVFGALWLACGPVAVGVVLGEVWSKGAGDKVEDATRKSAANDASSAPAATQHEMADTKV